MDLGLHVIKYPTGRFGFVGSVPAALAFTSLDGGTPDPKQVEIARHCGPGFAKQIKNVSWATREDALKAATDAGYTVRENT